ncbi:MAG: monofunctional biosynthetic peptidoglycan transglycosylase [Chitinophagales bacterium]|nr:monofunctional biosynthetic peptidoglycan transglycosylase [Chitinophagales bacterium]
MITVSLAWILAYRILPPPATLTMIQRIIMDEGVFNYQYVHFSKISPFIKVCALAAEDQNLPFHYGLDFDAINQAIEKNKKSKKKYGASTISQQVAKNAFLFPQRSYLRKGLELYFTFWIETLWPKEKILEMYLNISEMGSLVFGVEAASNCYFKKSASKISLKESASLIAVLPNPRKYKVKSPGNYIAARQSKIQSLYHTLDGKLYLRALYVRSDQPIYNFAQ